MNMKILVTKMVPVGDELPKNKMFCNTYCKHKLPSTCDQGVKGDCGHKELGRDVTSMKTLTQHTSKRG